MKKIINFTKSIFEWMFAMLVISIIGFIAMVISWILIAFILYIVWIAI